MKIFQLSFSEIISEQKVEIYLFFFYFKGEKKSLT